MNPFFQSRRFIVLLALLMGITALSIDAILPAFPEISQTFGLTEGDENRIQLMVIVFMLGFSLTQLLFGVLADVFGRKIILTTGSLFIFLPASLQFLPQTMKPY
ncbi:MFS transporter [Rappaport israeli]|uniref:MFS transporter n=1 Tax=Rappaport israeli TaxID=1839807 RepID=UPI000931969F